MSFDRWRRYVGVLAAALAVASALRAASPRFYPDDPITVDRDAAFDASGVEIVDLSQYYDFLENTFGPPAGADRRPIGAVNVNTLDEVPDSSWFTNRIGRGSMTIEEIVRGPDRVRELANQDWLVVGGKSSGLQPGFRAVDPARPRETFQLEVDPPGFPELATGAEVIGVALYHAIGFHVVDSYLVNVDPKRVKIGASASIRDASGRRRLVQADLDAVFTNAARNADGTYRMLATRFVDNYVGPFRYYGTRPDDPNDIYPHEHRRELRANRVFAAWLNHDDSRAINTLDMLVDGPSGKYIRHHMADFGSILGSATKFPNHPRAGAEYLFERRASLLSLATLGAYPRPWQRAHDRDDLPASVGRVDADAFEPEKWKPEYPNAAFDKMQPDDAFWGARIVASFSDAALRAVVEKARYSDPRATDYVTSVLIQRRDKIARTWLTALNPVVDFRLAADGTLTFTNAAVVAGAATPGVRYTLTWSRFDNATGAHDQVGGETRLTEPRAQAPRAVLGGSDYIAVAVRTEQAGRPAWARLVQVYFRRVAGGWLTVGLDRSVG